MANKTLVLGTRTSRLALWQTRHVIARLQAAWPDLNCQERHFVTKGDVTLDRPLPEIGGKGLFTAELEQALHNGEIDLAVHSLKDLPVEEAAGLVIGAIPGRADARDVLVARNGWKLATLPPGAIVGTSSTRRQAQLLAACPALTIRPIRGNVETRINKVMSGEYDATVLASAGLQRLGLLELVSEWLPFTLMLPAPGQAALAVQCRVDDVTTLSLLAAIDDPDARAVTTSERAFLAALGGGCAAPIAAYAFVESGRITMEALVASPDGRRVIRLAGNSDDPEALAAQLAQQVQEQGGNILLSPQSFALMPLHGRRIVVTRPAHQAQELCDRLRQSGAHPIAIPAIAIQPIAGNRALDEAIAVLHQYDWLIFTSANGVAVFWQQLAARQQFFTGETLRVAAVGPVTAAALVERGIQPAVVPESFTGDALATSLGDLRGRRVLLAQGLAARPNVAESLAAQGAIVTALPIYDTIPAEPDEVALAELAAGVEAVTFASGSAARFFAQAIAGRFPTLLAETVIACIGPSTAEVVRELGFRPAVVAEEHTAEGLTAALATYFNRQ
jgi:hydroxymethylbilane synthase